MKLTDTQLMLLSKATQMEGLVLLPANLKGAAAAKAVKPLLENGLIKEVLSQAHTGAWRRDEATGQYYGLLITDTGRAAINAEDDGKAGEQPRKQPRAAQSAAKLGQPPTGPGRKPAKRKPAKEGTSDGSPRPGSKLAKVIGMLSSKAGTTIEAIVKATDWQPHTTRAALTGLRKRGYRIEKDQREGGRTVYRIVGGGGARKSPAKKSRKRR
jgi:hypothetical protein